MAIAAGSGRLLMHVAAVHTSTVLQLHVRRRPSRTASHSPAHQSGSIRTCGWKSAYVEISPPMLAKTIVCETGGQRIPGPRLANRRPQEPQGDADQEDAEQAQHQHALVPGHDPRDRRDEVVPTGSLERQQLRHRHVREDERGGAVHGPLEPSDGHGPRWQRPRRVDLERVLSHDRRRAVLCDLFEVGDVPRLLSGLVRRRGVRDPQIDHEHERDRNQQQRATHPRLEGGSAGIVLEPCERELEVDVGNLERIAQLRRAHPTIHG